MFLWPCAGGALYGLLMAPPLTFARRCRGDGARGCRRVGFGLGPIGKLADSRRELRLRTDLQLSHDPLTLRCNEIGAAGELSLAICSSVMTLVTRLLDPSGALKIRHEHLANERPCSAEAPTRQHIARIMNSEIYAADTDQHGQDRGGHYEMNSN